MLSIAISIGVPFGAVLGGSIVLWRPSMVPKCAIHEVFGVWCPGCGMTRAFRSLADGDLIGSISYNALMIPWLAYVIGLWFAHAGHPWSAHSRFRVPRSAPHLLGSAVLIFTGARNCEFGPCNWLAPQ